MVRNSAKKLDNLDVRFVCNFISKKFHSVEKSICKYHGDILRPVSNVVLLP